MKRIMGWCPDALRAILPDANKPPVIRGHPDRAIVPSDEILLVNREYYDGRRIIRQANELVLYDDGEIFEIVHRSSKTHSLFRSETLESAEKLFVLYKDKIPVIQMSRRLNFVSGMKKLRNIVREHPTWTSAHIVARLGFNDLHDRPEVKCHLNSGDSTTGISPLQVAVQSDNSLTVRKLLEAGCSLEHLDHEGNNVYHYAASATKDIILTLGSGPPTDLNMVNRYGHTPMHVACLADKSECVSALLHLGANANVDATRGLLDPEPSSLRYMGEYRASLDTHNMKFGGRPLHWSRGREVISVLIEAKCDVNAVNLKGRTALHVMVMRKMLGCVIELLVRSAKVDVADEDGNTPLHLAAATACVPVIQALLAFDAPVDRLNNQRQTPRHMIPVRDGDGESEIESRRSLYVLHAVGAPRCPDGTNGCHNGCKDGEEYNGDSAGVPVNPESPRRSVLDRLRYCATEEPPNCVGGDEDWVPVVGNRLLCLDAGGIRGLVLVQILLEIEALVGGPIVRCFDWIAGTSSGGILALALASGKSLEECRDLYFRIRDTAILGARPYPSENLEDILKDTLGTRTVMADIPKPKLLITSGLVNRESIEPYFFRNYESPNYLLGGPPHRDDSESPKNQLVWRAACATGAATAHFEAFENFVDGGLLSKNPTLDALTEIHEYNSTLRAIGRASEARRVSLVVSFGTGFVRSGVANQTLRDTVLSQYDSFGATEKCTTRKPDLRTLVVDQETTSNGRVVDRAKAWCSMIGVPYYRFNPGMSEEIAINARDYEILVKMMWEVKAFVHENRDEINQLATLLFRPP